jgi:hypothetical protein
LFYISIFRTNKCFSFLKHAQFPACWRHSHCSVLTLWKTTFRMWELRVTYACCRTTHSQHFAGTTVLQNICSYSPNNMASHLWKHQSSMSRITTTNSCNMMLYSLVASVYTSAAPTASTFALPPSIWRQ